MFGLRISSVLSSLLNWCKHITTQSNFLASFFKVAYPSLSLPTSSLTVPEQSIFMWSTTIRSTLPYFK